MKSHSCGAVLYTIYNNKVYIILGKEHGDWFPFKGRCEIGETYEQAAVREIEEETCRLVKLNADDISLNCNFSTSRKYYHIGLNFVPYIFVKKFYTTRKFMEDEKCLEKTHIKMFDLYTLDTYDFHHVTAMPLLYYYPHLKDLQEKINKTLILFKTTASVSAISAVSSDRLSEKFIRNKAETALVIY
jgi:ADP-ribose pyrophosphatase YjhB (NUDIX family)